ncbi:GTA-gp10 family protein [Devosia sp. SL43]|uniref:GTA-gp10 family protein n=1 Tax=Devosia sp. SL43 TaxID=2806348 RepID=UPI001F2BE6ED|nr:GTA-gp10 family protein [Devosia sp. SL43]UJW85756.1 gene transfer agent family protein [Devosia sp. SL43]
MHKAFFGDSQREFSLASEPILNELERVTGKAIGAMIDDIRRLSFAEMTNTVRLGLVGGGTHPQEALALVRGYVAAYPLGELHLLALDILTDLWSGPEPVFREATDAEKAEVERRTARAARNAVREAAATGDLSAAINGGAVHE